MTKTSISTGTLTAGQQGQEATSYSQSTNGQFDPDDFDPAAAAAWVDEKLGSDGIFIHRSTILDALVLRVFTNQHEGCTFKELIQILNDPSVEVRIGTPQREVIIQIAAHKVQTLDHMQTLLEAIGVRESNSSLAVLEKLGRFFPRESRQ